MRKSQIEKLARDGRQSSGTANAKRIAANAPERPQERDEVSAVNLASESVEALGAALARAIRRELTELLPTIARLAAADTVHTMEQPRTVLDRAFDEGKIAQQILEARHGRA